MKEIVLTCLAIFTVIFIGGSVYLSQEETPVSPPPIALADPVDKPPSVDELLRLTNEERAKVGAKPFKLEPKLNLSAQLKSDDMAKFDYFAHSNPATGKHGYEYISEVGLTCKSGGENLAADIPNSKSTIYTWMISPAHKAALLKEDVEYVGFGISKAKLGYYVTQHFCDI